jgi:hypothetical protein
VKDHEEGDDRMRPDEEDKRDGEDWKGCLPDEKDGRDREDYIMWRR